MCKSSYNVAKQMCVKVLGRGRTRENPNFRGGYDLLSIIIARKLLALNESFN